MSAPVTYAHPPGSSPLTRGKLAIQRARFSPPRLIPAHAGKTSLFACPRRIPRAHPRSRGENEAELSPSSDDSGSSPLTRGKQIDPRVGVIRLRLIPAHAGKTIDGFVSGINSAAHPRSRGENTWSWPTNPDSPWLIPAHAGKTLPRDSLQRGRRAHPRSRGENMKDPSEAGMPAGSSPLTRGKLRIGTVSWIGPRLIPAHAGKTPRRRGVHRVRPAHPRSRGENARRAPPPFMKLGSSPLTRGKRALHS